MATLIPAIGSSAFDSTGERRLAERLEQKLDAATLLWHNVSIGPKQSRPDFVVQHARRGSLVQGARHDEGIPLLKPVSCEREGQAPVIIKLPALRYEAFAIADHVAGAHKEGHAWGDMAVPCVDLKTMDLCADGLAQRKLPHRVRKKSGEYRPGADAIQVMTMKVSKGLALPLVALPDVGHMPAAGEDEKEAARVFYVAATRAIHTLILGAGGSNSFGKQLAG